MTHIPRTVPRQSATFDPATMAEIRRAAATGIYDIRGAGGEAAGAAFRRPAVSRGVDLAVSARRVSGEMRHDGGAGGARHASRPITLRIPVTIAGMSFGSLSAQAKEALGRRGDDRRHVDDDGRWRDDR